MLIFVNTEFVSVLVRPDHGPQLDLGGVLGPLFAGPLADLGPAPARWMRVGFYVDGLGEPCACVWAADEIEVEGAEPIGTCAAYQDDLLETHLWAIPGWIVERVARG